MRIEDEVKIDFRDVLIRPKRSTLASRKEVDLNRTYTFKHTNQSWTGVPIMASNMDGVGTFEMASALAPQGLFTCLVKSYDASQWAEQDVDYNYVAVSTGTSDRDYENLRTVLFGSPKIRFICIDVANGYSDHFGDFIERVRTAYPEKIIIAGNVVTADMTQELILRGADIVKVGIGPGSVCTTRIQTGVGYPQLSAIIECADAAHGLGGHIIADGGCVCPGDVAKAFGAGADFVMLGGMLAGHSEGGGTIVERRFQSSELAKWGFGDDDWAQQVEKKQYVSFYGMSSDTAMNKHHGGVAEYRSSEGRTVQVEYRGEVKPTIQNILGGLRSACTYVGANSLKHFSKCVTFVRVNRQFNDIFVK